MLTKHVLVASRGPGFGALLLRPGRPVLALVGSLTLAAGAAHAQAEPEYDAGNFIPSPPNLPGLYHGIVSGDLNGDFSPEVAVIKGNTLIVFPAVDVSQDSIVVASDAIDVCFSPDAAGPGQAGLLYTSPAGLMRVTVQPGPLGQPNSYTPQLINGSFLWCSAKLIRSSPGVGQGPGEGLIGVNYDGHTFFSAYSVAGGFAAPTAIFSLTPTAYDIAPIEWNGHPDLKKEIAILHSNGIQVRDQLGNYLLSRSAMNPGDAIAAVSKPGLTDSLAWVTRLTDNLSNVLLFNPSFPGLYQPPQSLGSRVFGSLASADLEGDGDGDLVLGPVSWSGLQLLENDPDPETGIWYSTTAPGELNLSIDGGPGPQMAPIGKVLCANLFNDWLGDTPIPSFAAVLIDDDGLRVVPNLSGRYMLGEAPDFEQGTVVWPCDTNPGSWALELGQGWGQTSATHIELIVRIMDESTGYVRPAALRHIVYTLPNGPGQINGTVLNFTLDDVEGATVENDVYFAMVRPIRILFPHTTIDWTNRVWRWSIVGLPMDNDGLLFLNDQAGAGGTVPSSEVNCNPPTPPPGGPQGGSRYVPSPVLQSHIPGPGALPNIPPLIYQ